MLLINEIFKSISGEAGHPNFQQGTFCSFVRFQGCDLTCHYCDTKQSWSMDAGELMAVAEILEKVSDTENIVITGGEPQRQELTTYRQKDPDRNQWRLSNY